MWAGVALGLSQGTKFSALLIAPVWVAVGAAWVFFGERAVGESWPRRALSLAGAGMAASGWYAVVEGTSPDPALATRFWARAEVRDIRRTHDGAAGY